MKQHLLEHCEKSAEHHVALGKIHQRLHETHKAMAGYLGDGEEADGHRDIARAHGEAAAHHVDHAEHFLKLRKSLETARGDDVDTVHPSRISDRGDGGDLDGPRTTMAGNPWGDRAHRTMPTAVHGVVPDNPLRLIPRPGGPPVPEAEDATATIDKVAGGKQ